MYYHRRKKNRQKENQDIEIILTEYVALRSEAQIIDNIAIAIASLNFTLIGVIVTLVLREQMDNIKLMQSTFYFIIPCVSMFFGLLWIDQIFRRIRFAAYFNHLEIKINSLSNGRNDSMDWERWVKRRYRNRKFLKKTHQYYGYFVLGSNLLLPIISVGLGYEVFEIPFNKILLIVTITIFLVFFVFCVFYCREILSLNNNEN